MGGGVLVVAIGVLLFYLFTGRYMSTDDATLEAALRNAAAELKLKTGQMFQPIRVAVCGRKNAPPLFETLEALGRDADHAGKRLIKR